jgi:hypothetical protein
MPAQKPPRRPRKSYVTLRPGDTPASLAEKTGSSQDEIEQANPDAGPDTWAPGMVIRIPKAYRQRQAAHAAHPHAEAHAVRPDHSCGHHVTLESAALAYDLPLYDVLLLNPSLLRRELGEHAICLPPDGKRATFFWHVTGDDEDILSLARRTGTTPGALLAANPRLAPSEFHSGARVRVPRFIPQSSF